MAIGGGIAGAVLLTLIIVCICHHIFKRQPRTDSFDDASSIKFGESYNGVPGSSLFHMKPLTAPNPTADNVIRNLHLSSDFLQKKYREDNRDSSPNKPTNASSSGPLENAVQSKAGVDKNKPNIRNQSGRTREIEQSDYLRPEITQDGYQSHDTGLSRDITSRKRLPRQPFYSSYDDNLEYQDEFVGNDPVYAGHITGQRPMKYE